MDDLEEGFRGRFAFNGELLLSLEPDIDVHLTRLEATFRGTFSSMEAPFRVTLEGVVGELRKLGRATEGVARVLDAVADKDADAMGTLTLLATPAHTRALAEALHRTPDGDVQGLVKNVAFMTLLFALKEYEVVSIGTIVRTEG